MNKKRKKEKQLAKSLIKLETKKEFVIDLLGELQIKVPEDATFDDILALGYEAYGQKYNARKRTLAGYHACFAALLNKAGLGKAYRDARLRKAKGKAQRKPTRFADLLEPKKKPDGKVAPDRAQKFYRSYEWRKLRYQILQRDGARCALCGVTPNEGAVMNVDHIKPVRKYWTLRLDPENLQVLCNQCNHGKGNWDETDWRDE